MNTNKKRSVRLAVAVAVVSTLGVGAASAAGPVELVNVKGELKEKTLGTAKGYWLKLNLDVKVAAKVEKLMTVKVKATCKAGAESPTVDAMALGAGLDKLEAGASKNVDIRVFFDKPVAAKLESCSLAFTWGKSTKVEDATALTDLCWNGTEVAAGVCK